MKQKLKKVLLTKEVRAAIFLSFIAIFLFGSIIVLDRIYDREVIVIPDDDIDDEDVVVIPEEKLKLPFKVNGKIETYFFEENDPLDKREKSMINTKGVLIPSQGVDYSYNNQKFDVIAAFSGQVIDVKTDDDFGYIVKIQGENDLVARYSSLSEVSVKKGDEVKQGDVISKAGESKAKPKLNNHLHFELLKGGKHINPTKHLNKNIKEIGWSSRQSIILCLFLFLLDGVGTDT